MLQQAITDINQLKVINRSTKSIGNLSIPESMVESRDCMERCMPLHKQKKQQMLMDATGGKTLRILPVTALCSNITSNSHKLLEIMKTELDTQTFLEACHITRRSSLPLQGERIPWNLPNQVLF